MEWQGHDVNNVLSFFTAKINQWREMELEMEKN